MGTPILQHSLEESGHLILALWQAGKCQGSPWLQTSKDLGDWYCYLSYGSEYTALTSKVSESEMEHQLHLQFQKKGKNEMSLFSKKKKKKKKPSVRSACDSSAHKVWEYLTENQLPRFKWYVLINSFAKKVVTLYVCFSTVPISLSSFLQYWQLAKFKRQPN